MAPFEWCGCGGWIPLLSMILDRNLREERTIFFKELLILALFTFTQKVNVFALFSQKHAPFGACF